MVDWKECGRQRSQQSFKVLGQNVKESKLFIRLRALAHTTAKPEPGPTPAPDAM